MVISKTPIVINVRKTKTGKNKTGNLLALVAALNPSYDSTDSIADLVLLSKIPGTKLRRTAQPEVGATSPRKLFPLQRLTILDKDSKKLILDFNLQTGNYEIVVNDFSTRAIKELKLEVHSQNLNRRPRIS